MAKPAKSRRIFSPFMLTLAVMAGWAAAHEPPQFSAASLGVWICSAIAVALLARAVLALLTPLFDMLGVLAARAMKARRDGADS